MDPQILAIMMVVSLFALILVGVPVAFAIAGAGLFFGVIGVDLNLFNLLPSRIFGVLTNYTLLAIPLFVFMGILLEKSRLAEKMLDVLGLLSGKKPGGMAIAIIVVGILMGASTGIVGATVVTLTMIALPTLLKRNYSHSVSCGTICASGTLGQILPPSLVLILLADISGEAIGPLFAAALVPGLLLAVCYILYPYKDNIFLNLLLGSYRLFPNNARKNLFSKEHCNKEIYLLNYLMLVLKLIHQLFLLNKYLI